jgi:hypothetical protein
VAKRYRNVFSFTLYMNYLVQPLVSSDNTLLRLCSRRPVNCSAVLDWYCAVVVGKVGHICSRGVWPKGICVGSEITPWLVMSVLICGERYMWSVVASYGCSVWS